MNFEVRNPEGIVRFDVGSLNLELSSLKIERWLNWAGKPEFGAWSFLGI